MPKRKKIEDSYNNVIPEDREKYFNQWIENPNEFGIKMFSYFIKAEATSVIQVIVSSNTLYNGIFHIVHFNFTQDNHGRDAFETIDFELLKESKDNSFNNLIKVLPDIASKYEGQIIENINLSTDPSENMDKTYLQLVLI